MGDRGDPRAFSARDYGPVLAHIGITGVGNRLLPNSWPSLLGPWSGMKQNAPMKKDDLVSHFLTSFAVLGEPMRDSA
jgi:hypothetical protein